MWVSRWPYHVTLPLVLAHWCCGSPLVNTKVHSYCSVDVNFTFRSACIPSIMLNTVRSNMPSEPIGVCRRVVVVFLGASVFHHDAQVWYVRVGWTYNRTGNGTMTILSLMV